MLPTILKPAALDPDLASTWAWYGATQALRMLGLSCREAEEPDDSPLVIDPARGQFCLHCPPVGEVAPTPASALLRVSARAVFMAGTADQTDLPVFGPVTRRPGRSSLAPFLIDARTDAPLGEFMTGTEGATGAFRLQFNCHLFATLGLYLSRFSWSGNASFQRFVREIDDLWDRDLRARYGHRAVVNEYLQIIAGLLCNLYRELGLPLVTAWPHPCVNGQVMRHALTITHDVDLLFPDPSYRDKLDQTDNFRFGLPQWRALEERLDVRSAYYFYSPRPGDTYWCDPNYSPADPAVAAEIGTLLAGGWEVSLHQLSHDDRAALIGENEAFAQTVGQPTTGTRTHHLKHVFDTLSYKAEAGLRYDSTWYAEQTESDFLCGCALPYRPLDCRTSSPVNLWEFPFVLEDGIVFGVYGQGTACDSDGAVADGARALDQILAHDGCACLNWHNYTFEAMADSGTSDSWPPAMEGLVEYLRAHSPALWIPLPIELAEWCSRREAIVIETDSAGLRVRNTGDEACPDLVLCLQYPAAYAHTPPAAAQPLGQRGSRLLYALPVSVPAGGEISIAL